MKKISILPLLVLFSTLLWGCKVGNDNWVVVTDVQPGVYVTGEATIFSGAAPASQLGTLKDLDPADTEAPADVVAIDTWLKAGAPFSITIARSTTDQAEYGMGGEISSSDRSKVYSLTSGAAGFTVAEDGLYRLLVNTTLSQIHIIPIKWGVIGAATPGAWDSETALPEVSFDEATFVATYKGKVVMTTGEYKFRYSGDWGYTFDVAEGTQLKYHTNIGGAETGVTLPIAGGFIDGAAGGNNLATTAGGEYEMTVTYDLRTRGYKMSSKLIGEPTPPPAVTLPTEMFLIGSVNGWDWNNAWPLIPVNGFVGPQGDNGVSKYWTIRYFNAGDAIKFNNVKSWNRTDFGFGAVSAPDKGALTDDGGNIKVNEAGWYIVVVTTTLSEDGASLTNDVRFFDPNIYLVGNAAGGVWGTPNDFLFTVPETADGEFVSPEFAGASNGQDGGIRIAIALEGIDWWKTEFMIFDGKIEFRGNGGDLPQVAGEKGQKAYLKFADGTGRIE